MEKINELYLIRLRVVGVTDAVGEDESDSCGEAVPIATREAGDVPSGAVISRLISSLLRRDTWMENWKAWCSISYWILHWQSEHFSTVNIPTQ